MPDAMAAKRVQFLGAPMDALTMADTMQLIAQAITEKQALQHVVVNTAKLVNMQKLLNSMVAFNLMIQWRHLRTVKLRLHHSSGPQCS